VPTGITQNIEDLLRSEKGRAMLANAAFIIMLSQNATDRERLATLLKISDETMQEHVSTNSDPGSGLIFAGKYGVIPFENEFPKGKLYDKIDTAPREESSKKEEIVLEKVSI
jgi:hypothetical protein